MKIAGIKPKFEPLTIVFPRPTGDIVIIAGPVADEHIQTFDKMFPVPTPPIRTMASGERFENYESPEYKVKMEEYGKRRMAHLILRSISATPNLEFEKVDIEKPETWDYMYDELKEVFSAVEQNLLLSKVLDANGLNSDRIKEATDAFLASKAKVVAK